MNIKVSKHEIYIGDDNQLAIMEHKTTTNACPAFVCAHLRPRVAFPAFVAFVACLLEEL